MGGNGGRDTYRAGGMKRNRERGRGLGGEREIIENMGER
jgi:hypothetical protein